MPSKLLNAALAAMPLLGFASAAPLVTPYSDGDCKAQMPSWSYSAKNGTKFYNQPFHTGAGVSAHTNATFLWNYEAFSDIDFSAPTTENTLNSAIYWKVSQLGEGCRVLVMQPYAQTDIGSNIPGNIILNAGSEDTCYYTDPGQSVYMSFCCGADDCSAFNVGQSVLNTKRDAVREIPSYVGGGPVSSLAHLLNKGPVKVRRGPQPISEPVSRSGSFTARANALVQRAPKSAPKPAPKTDKKCDDKDKDCWAKQWGKCKISSSTTPISMPGQQQAVSGWVNCNTASSDGCQISMSHTTTHSSEVSVMQGTSETTGTTSAQSSSQTNSNTVDTTNTDGYSLSVGVSVGWGPFSASTDATTSHESVNTNSNTQITTAEQASSQSFSQTVSNSTGHSLTTAQGEQVSQTYTVVPGGYAILTFLPFYDCYTVTVDCGNPWVGPKGTTKSISTQLCSPAMNGDKVVGSYSLLYSNAVN